MTPEQQERCRSISYAMISLAQGHEPEVVTRALVAATVNCLGNMRGARPDDTLKHYLQALAFSFNAVTEAGLSGPAGMRVIMDCNPDPPPLGLVEMAAFVEETARDIRRKVDEGAAPGTMAMALSYPAILAVLTVIEQRRQDFERAEVLEVIVANARVQPDVSMSGSTDVYAVPMDDIERARKLL